MEEVLCPPEIDSKYPNQVERNSEYINDSDIVKMVLLSLVFLVVRVSCKDILQNRLSYLQVVKPLYFAEMIS